MSDGIGIGWRPTRSPARAAAAMGAIAIATVACRLAYGDGFVAYDSLYALIWGRDVARGRLPDFIEVHAPTPHPLANLLGVLLAPLGDSGALVLEVLSLMFLSLLAGAAYLLGHRLFSRGVGLLFAGIVLTRPVLVEDSLQAFIDVPYLALVVAAASLEAGRTRRGAPVLALLAAAGLLRPEAWLLSMAYWLYLVRARPPVARAGVLLLLAAGAPVIWAISDLAVTGNPVFSLVDTTDRTAKIGLAHGIGDAVRSFPRQLDSILGTPLLGLGALGLAAALHSRPRQAALPASLVALGIFSFFVLGVAELPLLRRYLLLPGLMLGLFAAVAVFASQELRSRARDPKSVALTLVAAAVLLISVPGTAGALDAGRSRVATRTALEGELRVLMHSPAVARSLARCGTVYVPTFRLIPLLAYWSDRPTTSIRLGLPPASGLLLTLPPEAPRRALLHHAEPAPRPRIPAGFARVKANRSWAVYERC